MAGKAKKIERRSRDPRLDNAYLDEVERDKAMVRDWMREEGLNLASAARRIGIARNTLERILSNDLDWSKRTIAPKRWTMYLVEQAAGIKTKKWRLKSRKKKQKTPFVPGRKNLEFARRGGR